MYISVKSLSHFETAEAVRNCTWRGCIGEGKKKPYGITSECLAFLFLTQDIPRPTHEE
jgi:hypothetical protein